MFRMTRRLIAILLAYLLVACASTAPTAPRIELPKLRLAPADFGATLSLAQRLTVLQLPRSAAEEAPREQTLDAQLEIEPGELRLAAFALNQRVLSLRWNGRELTQIRHPLLPRAVDAERVLRDVQLAYWPLASVRAALAEGWSVEDGEGWRELRFDGRTQARIDYAGLPRWQGRADLDNRAEGYRLAIESTVQ